MGVRGSGMGRTGRFFQLSSPSFASLLLVARIHRIDSDLRGDTYNGEDHFCPIHLFLLWLMFFTLHSPLGADQQGDFLKMESSYGEVSVFIKLYPLRALFEGKVKKPQVFVTN